MSKSGIAALALLAAACSPAAMAQAVDSAPASAAKAAPPSPPQAPPAPAAPSLAAASGPIVAYEVHANPPPFSMTTAGHAMFAMVGGIAAAAEGPSIARKNELKDPSDLISPDLAKAYAEHIKGQVAAAPLLVDADHRNLAKSATKNAVDVKDAAYVVDAFSSVQVIYFPSDWTHYRLLFSIGVRIIDPASEKVVAKTHCFIADKKTPESPTGEQLMANQAAVLKKMMADDAQACLPKLVEGIAKS